MPKAFQALGCVHSLHVQVVDGKEPCTREGSPQAELGQTSERRARADSTRKNLRQVHCHLMGSGDENGYQHQASLIRVGQREPLFHKVIIFIKVAANLNDLGRAQYHALYRTSAA